jgi:hypothetical protein
MFRRKHLLVLLFAAGCGVGFAYSYAMRARTTVQDNAALPVAAASPPALGEAPVPVHEQPEQVAAVDPVPGWMAAATGDEPAARAAAITALANAPAAQAVPVLRQVMETAEPADRLLALDALRNLAMRQGDADGSVREVLRLEAYDGTDESLALGAQAVLAELEDRFLAAR